MPLATLNTSSVTSASAASTLARAMSRGEDEVHRLRAVAEDQRRLAGGDALHPADEHLGVDAVDVHPRAVDVEVAQRDVVEAAHRVEAAQQALVEDLGGAVERVVGVGVVVLGGREVLGQAVDRGRRGGDDLADVRVDGRLEHVEGAVDEHLEREPRLLGALRDAQRGLVEDDVDAARELAHERAVADVALDDRDGAVGLAPRRGCRGGRARSCRGSRSPRPRARPAGRRGWSRWRRLRR